MLHFSKTARIFFIILSLRQVNNISFHMNLVSQLAALVCQPGVHRNINNNIRWSGEILAKASRTWLSWMLHFSKTARNFFMILSLGKVDNISFYMNVVSQLAALVCRPGVHSNKERGKHLIGRNLVISLYDILLDDIFLENGSKFFHNTFPALSWQYFLSFEPSQPIGRASLYDWRSWKHW